MDNKISKIAMSHYIIGIVFLSVLCCFAQTLHAQSSVSSQKKEYVYKQEHIPMDISNYLISTYYYNGNKAYNLRSILMATAAGEIVSMKIDPSGSTYALLSNKGDKRSVAIYDLWKQNGIVHRFKDVEGPLAMCYSSDARNLFIATKDKLLCYDIRVYFLKWSIDMPFEASDITVSDNGYYLAARSGSKVTVWNLENKKIRKEYDFEVEVNDIAFSKNSDRFGVLTSDELLSLYDTQDFSIIQHFDAVGTAKCLSFHPEGKYASVITGEGRIAIINLLDGETREYIENEVGETNSAKFLNDEQKHVYLVYNAQDDIIFKLMSQLAPNYTKLLKEELAERMSEWEMRMPDETLEEYNIRVNDETRKKQIRLFEEEIATRLADNLLQMSTISLGNYNSEENLLALNFDNLPTIYLNVPESELLTFSDTGNLEIRNARYGLNEKDQFELVYADVYNKSTGKSYVFDNRERRSLAYLKADDNFVPLDLVQLSNMEMGKLESIKDDIVDLAKKQNKISDHTNISVSSKVVTDFDAEGKKILNYLVRFTYTVEPNFSVKEDFAAGKYKAEESPAALSMLRIVQTAFENDFAQYVKAGKKVKISITGMADALPINRIIEYDGCYGDYTNEPVYKNGNLSNITVTKKDGINTNEQLAFMRATGVKEYITKNVPSFSQMETLYIHNIEVTTGTGGEYRRISVDFTFVDAF